VKRALGALALLASCAPAALAPTPAALAPAAPGAALALVDVAQTSTSLWNGVAVTASERVFVNLPRFDGGATLSVGELAADGSLAPFPGGEWNTWAPGKDPRAAFVGTNAIRVGPDGALWVVDTGTPRLGAAALPGGPKLARVDLQRNAVDRVYPFAAEIAHEHSHLDDVRFNGRRAYITDAGVPGIIVLDLDSGSARRVLDGDRSTTADPARPIVIDGAVLEGPDGKPLLLHADQLEVSPDGRWLYYQALSGPLYRIETRWLDDASASKAEVAAHVEPWFDTPALGGTVMDEAGNLYLADVGRHAILKLTPEKRLETIVQDARLRWPDAMSLDAKGRLWIPAAQIDGLPALHSGASQIQWPVHLLRLDLAAPAR